MIRKGRKEFLYQWRSIKTGQISISEIFDAEGDYTQRGCVAQAWSVAEVLRCWVKTSG